MVLSKKVWRCSRHLKNLTNTKWIMVIILKSLFCNLNLIFKKHVQEMKDWEGKMTELKQSNCLIDRLEFPRIPIKFGIEAIGDKSIVTAKSICTFFIITYSQIFCKVKSFCHPAEVLLPGESVHSWLVLLRGNRTKQG